MQGRGAQPLMSPGAGRRPLSPTRRPWASGAGILAGVRACSCFAS